MRYKIVVDDEDKAHEALIHSYRLHPRLQDKIKNEPKRVKGTIHTEMDSECPDGLPNCRNCGDPEYADLCRAAGHCPHCGIRHGIGPDSLLVKNGYKLETT